MVDNLEEEKLTNPESIEDAESGIESPEYLIETPDQLDQLVEETTEKIQTSSEEVKTEGLEKVNSTAEQYEADPSETDEIKTELVAVHEKVDELSQASLSEVEKQLTDSKPFTDKVDDFMNKKIDRRGFLKKLGRGAATAAEMYVGTKVIDKILNNDGEVQAAEAGAENENDYETKIKELREIIETYAEKKFTLSEEEIREGLDKCSFLDIDSVTIDRLPIIREAVFFDTTDVFAESLEAAEASGDVPLDEGKLRVLQTDFRKCGYYSIQAYYQREKNFIAFDEEPQDIKSREKTLQKELCDHAISLEFKERNNELFKKYSGPKNSEEGQKESTKLWEWYTEQSSNIESIDDLPQDIVVKFTDQLKEILPKYEYSHDINQELTRTNIPHESFHYFFEKQIGEDEYKGPDEAEIMAMVIKSSRQRFSSDDEKNLGAGGYADFDDIYRHLEESGIDLNDSEAVNNFCEQFTKKSDIIHVPPKKSMEEWESMSDQERNEDFFIRDLNEAINEYLARIYNGALGNTPESVQKSLQKISKKYHKEIPQYIYEQMYHEPTEEEIEFLKSMKWKGEALIK